MSTDQQDGIRSGRLALLALPVLCCVGHAALLALGIGSLAAVTADMTGRVLFAAAALVLAVAVLVVVLRRTRQR